VHEGDAAGINAKLMLLGLGARLVGSEEMCGDVPLNDDEGAVKEASTLTPLLAIRPAWRGALVIGGLPAGLCRRAAAGLAERSITWIRLDQEIRTAAAIIELSQ